MSYPVKGLQSVGMIQLDRQSQAMVDQFQKHIGEFYRYAQPTYFIAPPADIHAAAPLAADRSGCKAFCGHQYKEMIGHHTPLAATWRSVQAYPEEATGKVTSERQVWCTEVCKSNHLPPLAAQPAETKRLGCEYSQVCGDGSYLCGHHRRTDEASQPAPQPAPACAHGCSNVQANTACPTHGKPEPAEAVCVIAGGLHGGEVLKRTWKGPITVRTDFVCEGCYLNMENAGKWLHSTGTPYTGPERLERPKLAHSYGVECPALEDA